MLTETHASGRVPDAAVLRELGEWVALGFYEGLGLPWPRAYGLAYRRLYEHMPISLPESGWLVPFEAFPGARAWTTGDSRSGADLLCGHQHNAGLYLNPQFIAAKKSRFPQHAAEIDLLVEDLSPRLPHFGGWTHANPDVHRVVNEGFLAMTEELRVALAEEQSDPETRNLLLSLEDYAQGVLTFHARTLEVVRGAAAQATGVRQIELSQIADSFAHAFLRPARTFFEGLLAVHFAWMLDGCDGIGRLDQVLGPLFAQDLADGSLEVRQARAWLDELWQSFEGCNGWNLQIGGRTPDGRDGTNELTLECIAACERNHLRRPNVAFRITADTSEEALLAAVRVLARGSGRPALYNDDLYISSLLRMDLGLTLEDARDLSFGGCTETMIGGRSNVGSLEGEINLAKALELAMYDGFDPLANRQVGPHTGAFADFASFEEVVHAVKRQIQFLTDAFVVRQNALLEQRFHRGDPKLPRTMFTRDCLLRRRSFEAGGARYNWALVSYEGAANMIDGLAAIRQRVFQEAAVTKVDLVAALRADFEGYEQIQRLLSSAPRFGNDDPVVDDLGREVVDFAWHELYAHSTPRGGRYLPCCILFVMYLPAGLATGATPDGRRSGEVLTDSIGPAQGRDVHGPTAMLNSVLRLPLWMAVGTPVLNIRFMRQFLASEEGIRGVAALIRTFFAQGGMQIQLSVLDAEELRAAQRHPEQYRDLIVRIGGYSEYFTRLPRELQDSVLARTEYGG